MAIQSTLIDDNNTTILEVPAGKSYAVLTIMVCNTIAPNPVHQEDGLTNFDMHLIASGGAKGDVNMVIRALQMPAGETFTFDSEKVVLEAGDKIVIAGESPTVLSATVSYLEV